MRVRSTMWIVLAMAVCGNVGEVLAYTASPPDESNNGPNACKDAKFSAFTPRAYSPNGNNSEVPPKSEFSFFTTDTAYPKTITVTIKGQSVPVTVTPKEKGFQVTGKLPDTLKGTFARINITAKGPNHCEITDGWLLKVAN